MLGKRDQAVSKLLEEVFNAVLKAEAAEQLGAQVYERTEDRLTYRNGCRTQSITNRVRTLTLHVPKFRDGDSPPSSFAAMSEASRPCS